MEEIPQSIFGLPPKFHRNRERKLRLSYGDRVKMEEEED
jgi:hypothetical protein